jgi:hypothetical protein
MPTQEWGIMVSVMSDLEIAMRQLEGAVVTIEHWPAHDLTPHMERLCSVAERFSRRAASLKVVPLKIQLQKSTLMVTMEKRVREGIIDSQSRNELREVLDLEGLALAMIRLEDEAAYARLIALAVKREAQLRAGSGP